MKGRRRRSIREFSNAGSRIASDEIYEEGSASMAICSVGFVVCRTIRWMDGSARGLNDDSFAFEERMDRLRDR